MTTIAVFGATGFLGRRILSDAVEHPQVTVVAVARDAARARELAARSGVARDLLRVAEATVPAALRRALDGIDVAVGAFGEPDGASRALLGAALEAGVHLVDLTSTVAFVRWAYEQGDESARLAGCTVVPGAAADGVLGDVLAAVVAGAVRHPLEIHIAATTLTAGGRPGRRSSRRSTPGERREQAARLGHGVPAWVDGRLVDEAAAAQRRLAWFPRPVGPAHAAAVAGTPPLSVPRHVPGVQTVRTYAAQSAWRAELAQFSGYLERYDAVRRRRLARLARSRPWPDGRARAEGRWAYVAEARGRRSAGERDPETARAWANGRDLDRVAAAGTLVLAEAIAAGRADAGVLPPSRVDVPRDILDALSARTGLRWSVVRPPS